MSKLGQDLIQAADEGLAFARGDLKPGSYRLHIPEDIDVKAIRERFDMSQSNFAAQFAIPEPTLRDWEQHRRKPSGMARLFLLLLAHEPAAVRRVMVSLAKPGKDAPPARDDDAEVPHVHAGVLGRIKPHHRSPGRLRVASRPAKHRFARKKR
jgi:putative transcriptional regulator